MAAAQPFRCVLIGEESLLVQCAELALERGHDVRGVVADHRGIVGWAEGRGIRVIAPGEGLAERIGELEFDWLFSIANLSIVPSDVLALPRRGAINFHDGPLPRYAGVNATAWAILSGEPRHGVTWHLIGEGIDDGEILAQRCFEMLPNETSLTLNTRCYEVGITSFAELIDQLARGEEVRTPQRPDEKTYFGKHKRPPAACTIDWDQKASRISALVRALDFGSYRNPLGRPKARLGSTLFAIPHVEVQDRPSDAPPGTILSVDESGIAVATRDEVIFVPDVLDASGRLLETNALSALGLVAGARFDSFDDEARKRLTAIDEALARHEAYWATRLRELESVEAPLPSPTSPRDGGEVVRFPLRTNLDPDCVLAAFAAWIAKATGKTRFDLGYRHPEIARTTAEFDAYFAGTVPLRVEADFEAPVRELVGAVRNAMEASRRSGTHAVDLASRMPDARSPEYDVVFEEVEALARHDQTSRRAALTLRVAPDGAEIAIDSSRRDASAGAMLAERIEELAEALREDDSLPLERLPFVSERDRTKILLEWNATSRSYDREATIPELFERQVDRTPDATAIAFENRVCTYAEIDREANRMAHHLRMAGVGPERLVGLSVGRSPELVIAALAILKAGGAYVPLDPSYPEDRLAFMLEDSGASVVVTESAHASRFARTGTPVVKIDGDREEIGRHPCTRPERSGASENLAYVIYTSGSTGKPKGVMVEHRNVVNFFVGMDDRIPHREASSSDVAGVWLAVTSLSFDISVLELFWTLCRGFTVVLASDRDRALVAQGTAKSTRPIGMSLFYFASDEGENAAEKYRLLLEGARFADEHEFEAIWTPERHFHAFGGLYPNPSVAGAAIAVLTKHVKIRAGSCVLPLHHPIRVAEEWALVDNLSNGRVGISFAAGWQPNDFVLRPESFVDPKAAMVRDIDVVRRLWRGETLPFEGPKGRVDVRSLPRPIQRELPFWVTAAGNPATFEAAGRMGAGILTHLLGQKLEELEEKLAIYRRAYREAGHEGEGHVTLMLHTFLGDDDAEVKARVREPLIGYLKSSLQLIQEHAWAFPAFKNHARDGVSFEDNFQSLSPEDTAALLEHSFQRYYATSGLFGTVENAARTVERCKAIGVDEIACLIDFGVDSRTVLAHLPYLDELRRRTAHRDVTAGDHSIAALLRRHRVTHLQCTPSMARMLVTNEESRAALSGLEHLLVGGEALPGALVRELAEATHATITNMYGPTETTVWSSTAQASPCEGTVGIGTPIANTQMYVLDAQGALLPIGMPGELHIGGDGVTRGYLGRPELTAERFVPDPFANREGARLYKTGDLVRFRDDGHLEFLGRMDHQVKIRGYRIELGEIEAALLGHSAIREAVVMAREDRPGDVRLVAYVVVRDGETVSADALRQHAAATLPEFMVPAHVVTLPALPLTPNKKVDRKALPRPEEITEGAEREFSSPESEIEEKLAQIWQRILGLPKVGTGDNFFDLGGHSLLAVQAHREIRAALNRELTITDIFRFPTIRALADFLGGGGADLDRSADRAAARRDALRKRRQARGGSVAGS